MRNILLLLSCTCIGLDQYADMAVQFGPNAAQIVLLEACVLVLCLAIRQPRVTETARAS